MHVVHRRGPGRLDAARVLSSQVIDQGQLSRALSEFARSLVQGYDVSDVLYRLADHVMDVFAADGAGVALADESGRLGRATAANELSAAIEEVEVRTQEGPCVEALRNDAVLVDDLEEVGERWPVYAAAARRIGIRAVASIPMRFDRANLGSIDVYCRRVRHWSGEDVTAARTLADVATSYVVFASELERSRRTTAQLRGALESRVVIEQAKGVLAADYGVDVQEAFEVLRRHARSQSTSLRTIARAVVEAGLRPPRP